jgi:adenylate kinase family enzyme
VRSRSTRRGRGQHEEVRRLHPGHPAGRPTAEYLDYVLTRITLPGALYLGCHRLIPIIALVALNATSVPFGGTSILIVVGVGLETVKQIESQLQQRHYEGFLREAGLLGPPGPGKGTQAKRLADDLRDPGDLHRGHLPAQHLPGDPARRPRAVDPAGGRLVPDEVTNDMVRDRLAAGGLRRRFILDGYPRTLAQVDALDGMLEALDTRLDHVIELTVNVDEVVQRLYQRPSRRGATTTRRTSSAAGRRSTSATRRRWSTSTPTGACS